MGFENVSKVDRRSDAGSFRFYYVEKFCWWIITITRTISSRLPMLIQGMARDRQVTQQVSRKVRINQSLRMHSVIQEPWARWKRERWSGTPCRELGLFSKMDRRMRWIPVIWHFASRQWVLSRIQSWKLELRSLNPSCPWRWTVQSFNDTWRLYERPCEYPTLQDQWTFIHMECSAHFSEACLPSAVVYYSSWALLEQIVW